MYEFHDFVKEYTKHFPYKNSSKRKTEVKIISDNFKSKSYNDIRHSIHKSFNALCAARSYRDRKKSSYHLKTYVSKKRTR